MELYKRSTWRTPPSTSPSTPPPTPSPLIPEQDANHPGRSGGPVDERARRAQERCELKKPSNPPQPPESPTQDIEVPECLSQQYPTNRLTGFAFHCCPGGFCGNTPALTPTGQASFRNRGTFHLFDYMRPLMRREYVVGLGIDGITRSYGTLVVSSSASPPVPPCNLWDKPGSHQRCPSVPGCAHS